MNFFPLVSAKAGMMGYDEIVSLARKKCQRRYISSSVDAHHAIIANNLFVAAQERNADICIVASDSCKKMLAGCSEAASVLLQQGQHIFFKIKNSDKDFEELDFIKNLKDKENFHLLLGAENFSESFILVGDDTFWLEVDRNRGASSSFGDRDLGMSLKSIFFKTMFSFRVQS